MDEALAIQRVACEAMGSMLMVKLIDGARQDLARNGVLSRVLHAGYDRPLHDAVPLRLFGAVHRLVLSGAAPDLARFYPSAGGVDDGDPVPAFLHTVEDHLDEVELGMTRNVQTNEVGRAAALVGGFALVAVRTGLPLRTLEIGASAGLLSRWDRFHYDTGQDRLGPSGSPVRFDPSWWSAPPPLPERIEVGERRGCDIAPIDAATDDGRLTLLSFVWPDQVERLERLRAAIAVADQVPAPVDRADAAAWLAERLTRPAPGAATVVFHSIVWQYLPRRTQDGIRAELAAHGARSTEEAPLVWLRMEPAGEVADLRLTSWPGGHEEVVGTTGYHGRPVSWAGPSPSA
jgi:hypothetical protein